MPIDLDLAREKFESSQDFTIGLEEEFAILDPRTLELEHRFEKVYAACRQDEVLAESAETSAAVAAELESTEATPEPAAEATTGTAEEAAAEVAAPEEAAAEEASETAAVDESDSSKESGTDREK